MSDTLAPCFFALGESQPLALATCAEAGLQLATLEERRFEGGEFKLRPLQSVRNRTTFVLESLAGSADAPVCERLVRLLFLLNGLRDAGATSRIALVPYLAFARKDRRTQVRDPVSGRYVAQLLESSGLDRIIVLDVHNSAALDNSFRIPVDHLSAAPMMVDYFASCTSHDAVTVVSPDIGGIKRAQIFRELLEARLGREVQMAFVEKRRSAGVLKVGRLNGDVSKRAVIVIDDLCATGGTLIHAAEICMEAGAAHVSVAVSHAPLAAGLDALLRAGAISRIVVTDSVGIPAAPITDKRLLILPTAPLFGQALRRMLAGQPLAPLLSRWPV